MSPCLWERPVVLTLGLRQDRADWGSLPQRGIGGLNGLRHWEQGLTHQTAGTGGVWVLKAGDWLTALMVSIGDVDGIRMKR